MRTWWSDLETDILNCLSGNGPLQPHEIGQKLGMSESAVTSVLSMLASDGKVRIRLVEAAPDVDAHAEQP